MTLRTGIAIAALLGAAGFARPAAAAGDGSIAVSARAPAEADLRLGRAALEYRLGHPREVVASLAPLDFAAKPGFAEADRAAFLLGQAYQALGSRDRFESLAAAVAGWGLDTPYTRWIAHQRRLVALSGAGVAGAAPDSALRDRAARDVLGAPDPDTSTALGRDLAGARWIERATRAMERGEDARPLLERVPAGSRYASRSKHLLGQIALESGDRLLGRRLLEELLAGDPGYPARREVMLALAGAAMDSADWESASRIYSELDRDWTRNREDLLKLKDASRTGELWQAWSLNPALSEAWILDPEASDRRAALLAGASTRLGDRPADEPPSPELAARTAGGHDPVPPPTLAEWRSVTDAEHRWSERRYDADEARWRMARELERLGAWRDYLERGNAQIGATAAGLATDAARLDSLRRTLDAVDVRLKAARDEATRRILARTSSILEDCDRDQRLLSAMRLYHLEGPHHDAERLAPPSMPSPDSLVREEASLARLLRETTSRFAAEMPALIARSYTQAWRPRLVERVGVEAADVRASLAWTGRLGRSVDSSLALAGGSEALRALAARAATLSRQADSLHAGWVAQRAWVASAAVDRALAALEPQREAIDYGLAAAAYGRSVRLGGDGVAGRDSTREAAGDSAEVAGGDPADDGADPLGAAWRTRAIAAARTFLLRHPDSPSRAEMRFRLADLVLVEAHHDFEQRMAAYLEAQSRGETQPLPVLEQTEALAIYRSILAEDPGFEHRDAVLFNVGTLLADQGDPEAERYFRDLVTLHPQSGYVQEAELRRGDLRFNEKQFADCAPFYERAATGPDPSLQAIALYKLGWASFNENRFRDAADAFRRVLDLYESGRKVAISTDLRPEAEAYLVHSLARAGGAPAFAAYFDSLGHRPYETRVLMTMGQQFRRFSMVPEAAATDRLVLERAPQEPEALLSAERLVETYHRWKETDREREAQLQLAPAFAPGGTWSRAQKSDSLRDAGAAFARTAWLAAAHESHRAAREHDAKGDWAAARQLYEQVLRVWPRDSEAAVLHMSAGEASEHLGERATALAHYREAEHGPDSLAAAALLQQVAVTDAWYRSAPGDSLAHAVIAAGDRLLDRFPAHPHRAELEWRQGNLAFAHGWYERAAQDFGRLAERDSSDAHAPRAAILRADALFKLRDYEGAGAAYGLALGTARRAGVDSLAHRAAAALPTCDYLAAEAAVAADSSNHAQHAALFERVATRWPDYEHADVALYRAGLARQAAGSRREAVRVLQTLAQNYPKSEYARDARLEMARTLKDLGDREQAADAYADFVTRFPADSSARAAWLESADLYAAAGKDERAQSLRLAYIRRYPDDVASAMEILEALARRDLATVGHGRTMASLLPPPVEPPPAPGKGGKSAARKAPAAKPAVATPPSYLAEYLKLAAAHPKLASPGLIAEIRFRQAEETRDACAAVALTLPLDQSLAKRVKLLDRTLAEYRQCVDVGVPEWAHASAFRIGEALVAFGEALEHSERPADLKGEDLKAYERVLGERSDAFYDRGENAWVTLVRQQPRDSVADEWVKDAQTHYWSRLSNRFFYKSEAEFPLVAASEPQRTKPEKLEAHRSKTEKTKSARGRGRDDAGGDAGQTRAQREGAQR